MKTGIVATGALVLSVLVVVACGEKRPPPKEPPHVETVSDAGPEDAAPPEPPKPKSLFTRLGKQEGITKVVETFMKNLATDAKFNKRLATVKGAKLDKAKKELIDVICVESGGPEEGADCKFEGRFMKEVLGAKGRLKEDEWIAMLLDLRAALEENTIANDEQQDLAAVLGKFRDDTVEAPKGKK